jgi:hypothetical protein
MHPAQLLLLLLLLLRRLGQSPNVMRACQGCWSARQT